MMASVVLRIKHFHRASVDVLERVIAVSCLIPVKSRRRGSNVVKPEEACYNYNTDE